MALSRGLVDLHVHSSASDGILAPREAVAAAVRCGLAGLALTDHDTVAGLAEAQAEATASGLRFLPGVELSADGCGSEIHVLGYGLDFADTTLLATLQRFQENRAVRATHIIDRLAALGLPLHLDEVLALAGEAALGRAHIARALVGRGYAPDTRTAFHWFLTPGRPGYVPRTRLAATDAIRLVREAGGVAVLAHPGTGGDDMLPGLVEAGLRGLEVYHPDHTPVQRSRYLEVCQRHGLVATGGSDYHGYTGGAALGACAVPADTVGRLLDAREERRSPRAK
ncbi:MAG: PHP domain-containing protein [Bacillota bacterium]